MQWSRMDFTPLGSTTTISPGSTSRTNSAPQASRAQVSLANTYPLPSLPIHKGRNPLGSLAAISFLRTHHQQGISSLDLRHSPADRLLDGAAVHPFSGDNIGDYLRINGSLENRPPVLQLPADFMSVCQVTVMGDGQGSLDIPHHQRLGVFRHTVTSGRIPHMADAHLPGKLVQNPWDETPR